MGRSMFLITNRILSVLKLFWSGDGGVFMVYTGFVMVE